MNQMGEGKSKTLPVSTGKNQLLELKGIVVIIGQFNSFVPPFKKFNLIYFFCQQQDKKLLKQKSWDENVYVNPVQVLNNLTKTE